MKGKTEIVLTNVRTGEIERHTHENRFTGALDSLFNGCPYGLNNGLFRHAENLDQTYEGIAPSVVQTPLYKEALGGLLLFPSTIDAVDDVDPLYKFDEEPTGYASYDAYSGEDAKRGNLNTSESKAITGGYQFVYDFSTSQANGKINSVCLTHRKGGHSYFDVKGSYRSAIGSASVFSPYGYRQSLSNANTYGSVILATDDAIYTSLNSSSTTQHLYKIPFKKNRLDLMSMLGSSYGASDGVIDMAASGYNTPVHTFALDRAGDVFAHGNKVGWVTTSGNSSGSATITVYLYDVDTDTETSQAYSGISAQLAATGGYCLAYDGTSLYLRGRSNNLIRVNLSNLQDIDEIALGATANQNFGNVDGFISGNSVDIYPQMNNAVKQVYDTYTIGIGRVGVWQLERSDYNINSQRGILGACFLTPYLATINNLSSEIEKTADKTMKVIYTVYED